MIYFTFSFFSVVYFYLLSSRLGKINSVTFFAICLPFLFFYFLFPALQYEVGTDYFNYINMYQNPSFITFYDRKYEFFFSHVLRLVNEINSGGQFIFVIYSFVFAFLMYILIFYINKKQMKVWLFLFAFLFCSGVYQNQMNGIRQYSAIYVLIISLCFFIDGKLLKTTLFFMLGMIMHSSFLLNVPIYVIKYIKVKPSRCFLGFIFSFLFFAFFVPVVIPHVVRLILPQYLHYLDTELVEGWSLFSLLPKLYYVPFFLLFIVLYSKEYKYNKENSILLKLSFLGCCLYWCFLSYSSFGLMTRVGLYWTIFNCFPIYYVLNKLFENKRYEVFMLLLLYLILPFSLKVLFFPINEYSYQSILG